MQEERAIRVLEPAGTAWSAGARWRNGCAGAGGRWRRPRRDGTEPRLLDKLQHGSHPGGGRQRAHADDVERPQRQLHLVARLQGKTGEDGGGNNFRYDCTLAGPEGIIDNPIYRVGETNSVENYLTYQGGYTGAGPIALACRSANVHTLKAITGSLVATKVGGLN